MVIVCLCVGVFTLRAEMCMFSFVTQCLCVPRMDTCGYG